MSFDQISWKSIKDEMESSKAELVAVSKTKPVNEILDAFNAGQVDFGENYVQELVDKQNALPDKIRWHFIGHLQRNKVKQIVPFIHLIHGVDSIRLLREIDKQGVKAGRRINCLLQIFIATEETKFGMDRKELDDVFSYLNEAQPKGICVKGLMGMASFTSDEEKIRNEFKGLRKLYDELSGTYSASEFFEPVHLSMGMSSDYKIALEERSNMIRIGSLLFGSR